MLNFSSKLFDISYFLISVCLPFSTCLFFFCLDIAMLESTKTISWSLMPSIALHLLINDGRFVKNTSNRCWPLVGKLTDCIPKSSSSARKISLISLRYWLLLIVFEDQLISGKFKSPPNQMVDFVFLWQMSEMIFGRSINL